jgi:hypothetical protein
MCPFPPTLVSSPFLIYIRWKRWRSYAQKDLNDRRQSVSEREVAGAFGHKTAMKVMGRQSGKWFWGAMGVVWLIVVAGGVYAMLTYENTPGRAGDPPATWPAQSGIPRTAGLPTIVVIGHPKCPCTRATIGELAVLVARLQNRATAVVVLVRPRGAPANWDDTDLKRSAAEIPGVTVMSDLDEVEADRFQAQASGQTMLYDKDGRLLFSGGITASRGHSGDNAGRSSIVSLVNYGTAEQTRTPVFGCALRTPTSLTARGEKQ